MSGIRNMRGDAGRTLSAPYLRVRRIVFAVLVVVSAALGTATMAGVVGADGLRALDAVTLALFAVTFAWIANAFWNAAIGCWFLATGRDPLTLQRRQPGANSDTAPSGRTALVMPVHNEDPERALRGLEATVRSLLATGQAGRFAAFLLSDTTDPVIADREERAWAALRERLGARIAMHYRRRPLNTGRKPGNIADFCDRHGAAFDYMVVLDADSVMAGTTLVELVRLMDANPGAGLLQTVPIPVRQSTLFGRLFQFAAALYSPMLGAGISFWSGDAANYWGHNAIIRVAPFARHCRLPVLSGQPPLGGDILSHDFVEAAWLRRAGWDVWLLPHLGGSYEEMPANGLDYLQRDRRWTQGNLQHLRLLGEPGLHVVNRVHFLQGAMSYLAAPLWLALLLFTTAGAVLDSSTGGLVAAGQLWGLLAVTGGLVLAPRLLGLGQVLSQRPEEFGGRWRLAASGLLELVFSVLLAPLLMLFHSRFVGAILAGSNVRWEAQPRDGRAVRWHEAVARTAFAVATGSALVLVLMLLAPALLPWLAPILPGLLVAPWLIHGTSRSVPANHVRSWLMVPSEVAPEPVLVRLEQSLREETHALHDAVAADAPVVDCCGYVDDHQQQYRPAQQPVRIEQRVGEGLVFADQRRQIPGEEVDRVTAGGGREPAHDGHRQQ